MEKQDADRYRDGHSLEQVGQPYHLTRERVRQILERDCPEIIRRKAVRPKRDDSDAPLMAKLYRDGHSLAEVGEQLGISAPTVGLVLNRLYPGLVRPRGSYVRGPRGPLKRLVDRDRAIVDLYRSCNYTQAEIALAFEPE
jgi:hypothetical protein